MADSVSPDLSNTVVNGRFALESSPIASGGMGQVWVARDVRLDREVAVKFVRFPHGQPDDELVRRFVRESRIAARLQHPGVPAVFDAGLHEGRPYLVMQRIQGRGVDELLSQAQVPVGWAAAIAAQTCAVLAAAHQASLIHRDLKPANLILEPHGTVKVLDFGLAVALDYADFSRITESGDTVGTPAYMAPEQVRAGMSTPRTDLYALGCTLFELVAGRQLFAGSTVYSVMHRQVDERPPSLVDVRGDVPEHFADLVGQLLAKKPEDRPASAGEVFDRLLPFVEHSGAMPGGSSATSTPVQMYAQVLVRTLNAAVEWSMPASSPETAPPTTGISKVELGRVRDRAQALVRDSRGGEAAELLEEAVTRARQAFGDADAAVLGLRREWADALFEAGDYRRAGPAYERLAADLAGSESVDSAALVHCRTRHATSHALTGDSTRALQLLHELLADEERTYGQDDPRPLELRRQIGMLQLGAGQHDAAEATLRDLVTDLVRLYGDDHPALPRLRELVRWPPAT